jgi:hypothetical protein
MTYFIFDLNKRLCKKKSVSSVVFWLHENPLKTRMNQDYVDSKTVIFLRYNAFVRGFKINIEINQAT